MIYINNYCTDFTFIVVMVCVTYCSTILFVIIFNFLLVFKISPLFGETLSTCFNYEIHSKIPTKKEIS